MMSWRLNAEKTGMLVIDVQERLLPAMKHGPALLDRIVTAVSVARLFGLPIFHTEHFPAKLGPTASTVRLALGDDPLPVRTKEDFSAAGCFAVGELRPFLLVVGVETHVCVRQTVFDLRARGHTIYLLADAMSSRSADDHRLALHDMREYAGARVTSVETVAWELLETAADPRFRELLALLK